MSDNKIVLVGYSGHGLVVAEAAMETNMNLQYYAEKKAVKTNPYNFEYLGFEGDENFSGWEKPLDFVLGIGDNTIRRKVAHLILKKQKNLLNVIDTSANVSKNTIIGQGNFIAKNSTINTFASIGDYCILNTGCIVEHECKVSNGVHIAPGAVLLGNVIVGEGTFIGANAVIKENTKIGSNVIIGAGTVVLEDILDENSVWVGNPAKRIK